MSKFRDLFTEKKERQLSLYHNKTLKKMNQKINYSLHNLFNGPITKMGYMNSLIAIEKQSVIGRDHVLFTEFQKKYGNGLRENIILPYVDIENFTLTDLILVSDPDDCERIAKKHIQKMPNFKLLLHDSIISTTDNDHWKRQRFDLVEAFSPLELNEVLHISEERAKKCSNKIWNISKKGKEHVNISDFFLNETLAQLQLAMFGLSNEFQEDTNKKLRDAFGGKGKGYTREYALRFLDEIKNTKGPLSRCLNERVPDTETEAYGNALVLNFAGHDTTGHTLTWLIYELCKNQSFQKKLQREVDHFWITQKNTKINIKDFKRLPFMTRCITETLRLWTAVPNGTFRELIEDEQIKGKYNMVNVPKGTYVQIFNYSRHLNPELWGEDVNDFNPEREFKGNEIWNDEVHAFYNPSTKRFSPFTYGPRDCIGKNFSQMEMRLILLHLIKDYHFILTESQNKTVLQDLGINKATLAPMDILNLLNEDNKGFRPYNTGMYVYIIKRSKSKL